MPQALWTADAAKDLEEIAYYIGQLDARPLVADRIVDEIKARADFFAAALNVGQTAAQFPAGWQFFRHKRWIVLYREVEAGIEVLRVIDGSREFGALFPT